MRTLLDPGTLDALRVSDGYASLGDDFVERRDPTPLPDPYIVAFSPDAAALVGLAESEAARPEFVRMAAGCARFSAVAPYAAVYAGHQFGSWVSQLGDGRAITLGEVAAPGGARYEWQIKGAGRTAFSRFGDGRAVLRSTIREYLCSEAMAALAIPTTRALAIAGSDVTVYRETPETAAVLTRLAPSMLRFGTFEFFHHRGEAGAVRTLADYAIATSYPELATIEPDGERYAAFLRAVVERTADLFARWHAVGFAHGVLNTDNMSIHGLTLDYGPFGFLDAYEPSFICNHTDAGGRYAFDRQPSIGLWNCHALATALSTLVDETAAEAALAPYRAAFQARYTTDVYRKFGLSAQRDDDGPFFEAAFAALAEHGVDYTNLFRALCDVSSAEDDGANRTVLDLFGDAEAGRAFLERYRARLAYEPRDDATRAASMRAANPKYVLRNYLAERAIVAARERDYSELSRLHDVLRRPFDEQPERAQYAAAPPAWAKTLSVSCSS